MPQHTSVSRGFRTGMAALLLCASVSASAVDIEADWQQRKSASGVVYAESFDFASKADLPAASAGYTNKPPANEIDLDSSIKLSGAKSLKLITYGAAGANGGSWANHYDKAGNQYRRFYFQFSIYLPRDTLAYRSQGGDGQLKLVNLEQYGAAQIVVSNRKFLGFPTFLLNGSATLESNIAESVVPNVSSEYVYQTAADTGSPESPANACEFWGRYGPARGISINDDYGASNPEPYLYRRNLKWGWPNSCALKAGVPFNLDGWTTIEVYVDYNTANPAASTIKGWAAPYGQAPRLYVNEVNTAKLNANDSVYRRFELLNYDTPRLPEDSRPAMFTYFDEIIISTQPVKFPGGFALPATAIRPEAPTSLTAH